MARPGVAQDQATVSPKSSASGLKNTRLASLPSVHQGGERAEGAEAAHGDPPHQVMTPSTRASGSAGRQRAPSGSRAAKPEAICHLWESYVHTGCG